MNTQSTAALRTVVQPVATWNPLRAEPDEVFNYIDLSAVDQETKKIVSARELPCTEAPSRARQLVKAGDVIISTVRPNLNGVAQIAAEFDGATASTGFCVLRADSAKLNPSYLFQWVKSGSFVDDMVRKATGASYPAVSDRIIADSLIPLPPPPEQRRIAAILDQAETLRTQRRAALAQLDSLTQSVFLEMFGDGNTPEPTIGEMLKQKVLLLHKDGNHGSLYPKSEEFGEIGVPFLSARCITDGGEIQAQFIDKLQEVKANKLRIGWIEKYDVLLAHNASVGKVALYDGRYERALIGTSLTAFRVDPSVLSPHFLAAAFRSTKFQSQLFKNMGQTTRNQVPITAQRELRVAFPPLPLQQTFATRIQAIEALKTTHRSALAALDALFASLQQRAFAGQL